MLSKNASLVFLTIDFCHSTYTIHTYIDVDFVSGHGTRNHVPRMIYIFDFTDRVPRKSYYEGFLHNSVSCAHRTFKHRFFIRFRVIVDSGAEWYDILWYVFLYKIISVSTCIFLQKQWNWVCLRGRFLVQGVWWRILK